MILYNQNPAHREPKNAIIAAARALGVEPPTWPADQVAELLDAEPGVEAVLTRVTDEARNRDSFGPDWLEDALDKLTRAHAADSLRRSAVGIRQYAARTQQGAARAAAVREFTKPVSTLLERLGVVAAQLPAHALLDDAAAVATGAGTELAEARDILRRLSAAVETYRPTTAMMGELMSAHRPGHRYIIGGLVELPAVEPEKRAANMYVRKTLNPSADRDAVREFTKLADDDLDAAILRVARGEFPPLRLSWAESSAEVRERVARLARAQEVERVPVTREMMDLPPDPAAAAWGKMFDAAVKAGAMRDLTAER